ncbi:helix-turn-helix domain-containing protein [Leeuwenhoekiella sp. H156]|uniref:helix-turn-helix domain-containing protein n=1 Tax=Leeuwenhoekiella sp. H156 TaxID=3450128 RepID=UPI003FA41F85
MKKEYYIKNMVCDRCKQVVQQVAEAAQAKVDHLQLGNVVLEVNAAFDEQLFENELQKKGFELMQHPEVLLAEEIKLALIERINDNVEENLPSYLVKKLNRDYSLLSKTFKKVEGQTLEKFVIKLKIEKVKEFIQMNRLSFSEIAHRLGYKSIHHLSGQFKTTTGMTMSAYKNSQEWNRIGIDNIV